MACPVIAWFRFRTAALALLAPPMAVFAQTAQPATMQCTPDTSAKVPKSQRETLQKLQQSVESGPLYRELVSASGKPQACKVTLEKNAMTLTYLFNEEGHLQVTIDPTIEFSEEKVKLPKLPPITEEQALALLKAAEKHSFGENGCGIKWSKPLSKRRTPGLREVSYLGDVACAASKLYRGDRIAELSLIRFSAHLSVD
jgi:hypothetical protein